MIEFTRIAVDTSKYVFTLQGIDATGKAVLRRNLRRASFVEFFRTLRPTQVVKEACGGSHHCGHLGLLSRGTTVTALRSRAGSRQTVGQEV